MEDQNQPKESAALAIPKRCPIDGALMYEGMSDGLPAWLCPECDYVEYK